MSQPAHIYTLYRLYDAAGTLLYIGLTRNVATRFSDHRNLKPWFPDVARTRMQPFTDPGEAVAAETRAHQDEHPRHNGRRHIPYTAHRWRPKPPAKTP
jgi:predicted GIY-YIG superfamily endonuclease